jgi:hypothetical protein
VQVLQMSNGPQRLGDYRAYCAARPRGKAEPIQVVGEEVELFRTCEHRSLLIEHSDAVGRVAVASR